MKSLAPTLAGMSAEKAARLRGLVVRQLIESTRAADRHFTLLHLFLLPPAGEQTRFRLYEVVEPVDVNAPIRQVVEDVREELTAAGDPRLVADADDRWQRVDPGLRAFYVGTGARFITPHSDTAGTTIMRLADATAVVLSLDAQGRPASLQTSKPVVVDETVYPAIREIEATGEPPFVLIDMFAQLLQVPGEGTEPFRPFG
ncbi:hypothetical protein [Amycolatopsis pithecellobii]|uniref:Uncharacterized protein n=1 Tax=Amycolatopsis pithecellobii TaxID=664692 RepID=A0A6N7Z5H8_9PSEU|nr:hypothetical protein [Amycolatopsis pithecellobii]MTD57543.1 hypothetical protein [Amycolatopsis pithecellobii]